MKRPRLVFSVLLSLAVLVLPIDPADPATAACLTPGNCHSDYTRSLNRRALNVARIAVPSFSYWTDGNGTPNLTPNTAHADVALKYNQVLALAANALDTTPGSQDEMKYQRDRAKDLDLSRTRGLDMVYSQYDAVLFPANRGANIAARAGYPSIVVPGGFVTNRPELNIPPGPKFPDDFNPKDAPYGVTFSGPAFSEPKLIGFAYAFEQASHHRQPPDSTPPLSGAGPNADRH